MSAHARMNDASFEACARWTAAGEAVAAATVVKTWRSAPRPLGAVFAVSSAGRTAGSVSGGCIEGEVYAEAQALLRGEGAPVRLLHYGVADEQAFEVGLACGGEIWLLLQRWQPRPALRRGAIVTAASGPRAGERLVFDAERGAASGGLAGDPAAEAAAAQALERGRSAAIETPAGGLLFAEAVAPPPRAVIVGAVDTAEHLCRALSLLGWRSAVVDPRSRFAAAERLPSAERVVADWPEAGFAALGLEPADHVVVLSHDPKIDDDAIAAALRLGCRYVGALGSRRTQAKRRERLAALGLSADELDRVHGPVGLDVGAETPQEVALAIAAELIAVRAGRDGAPLRAGAGPITPRRA